MHLGKKMKMRYTGPKAKGKHTGGPPAAAPQTCRTDTEVG